MSGVVLQGGDFLARAQATIRRRTGLVFNDARQADLARGLDNVMQRAGQRDPERYLARLETDARTLDDLVGEITVGETYFFREPEQFAVIRERVLPDLLSRRDPERAMRVWSAGCATGEEPYSIAILLNDMGWSGAVHVLGTDIARTALARARRGCYTPWSFRGVSETVRRTYFVERGREWVLSSAIRAAVDFGYLNLAEDVYPSLVTGVWGMDLILCRNVLIYFDVDTVTAVARRLLASLADGGWLLLGASDPMLQNLVPCEVVVTRAGLAYRRALKAEDEHGRAQTSTDDDRRLATTADEHGRAQTSSDEVPLLARARPSSSELVPSAAAPAEDPERAAVREVRSLANRGDLGAAGRACAAALDRHRTSAELTYLHAVLLAEGGRVAEAAGAARAALYLDRTMVVAHLALGAALGKLGDREAAGRSFKNAARLLAPMPADAAVPAADGEPAGRMAEMVRLQLRLLGGETP